jgi:hypothetical protein
VLLEPAAGRIGLVISCTFESKSITEARNKTKARQGLIFFVFFVLFRVSVI